MPYIKQEDRGPLNQLIDDLAKEVVKQADLSAHEAAFAGVLNYTFTRLTMCVIKLKFGQIRYWVIAIITGVLKNVNDEFYRRMGVPYEDIQISKNGDVDLYEEFATKMK